MELKESLQKRVEEFKKNYPVDEQVKSRITQPSMAFYGTEILNRAVTALLEGENLLLCGDKATGKNILAEISGCLAPARSIWSSQRLIHRENCLILAMAKQKYSNRLFYRLSRKIPLLK